MDVRDEITKNTEIFEKKFSTESSAEKVLKYLKESEKVIFISTNLINKWRIDLAVFTSTLKEYGIFHVPLMEVTFSSHSFYGILICSNVDSLKNATNMYGKIYRERSQNSTLH